MLFLLGMQFSDSVLNMVLQMYKRFVLSMRKCKIWENIGDFSIF